MSDLVTKFSYRDLHARSRSIIIFGEAEHGVRPYTLEIQRALEEFRLLGFSCFAVEMLPSGYNDRLKQYTVTGRMSDDLVKYLGLWTHRGDQTPRNYRELIAMARRVGMSVIGLDIHVDEWRDLPQETSHLKRNIHMAAELAKVVKGGDKVVALMHRFHAETTSDLGAGVKRLLKENHQLEATFIKLVGGTSCIYPHECKNPYRIPAELRAIASSAAGKRFYIEGAGTLDKADFILHLPQTLIPLEEVARP